MPSSPARLTYCTDCHTSSDAAVRGPHGSANRYILKKPYTASSASRTMTSGESCFDCHSFNAYANAGSTNAVKGYSRFNLPAYDKGHTFHVVDKRYPCYACHETHGSTTLPHLIVTGRSLGHELLHPHRDRRHVRRDVPRDRDLHRQLLTSRPIC